MKNKGSLTVEATLAATVFICIMFVLLSIIRLVVIEYALSYATYESAKSIADISYIVNMVNDLQEDLDDQVDASIVEKATSLGEYKMNSVSNQVQALIGYGLSKDKKKAEGSLMLGASKMGVQTILDLAKQIGTGFYGVLREPITNLKTSMKTNFVQEIISETIDERGIKLDKNNLMIEVVKFPETNREFLQSSVNLNMIKNGLKAGVDYDKNDVVVVLSYKTELEMPFMPSFEFRMRKIAIEKSWINGDNGIITKFGDSGFFAKGINTFVSMISDHATQNNVYIINNSTKYHRSQVCGKIGDKHTTPVKEYVATSLGYSACGSCQ